MRRLAGSLLVPVALCAALGASACTRAPTAASGPTPQARPPVGPATSTVGTSTVSAPSWPPSVRLVGAWTGFDKPVQLTYAPDGSDRMFVVELPGRVRLIEGGRPAQRPFLDVTGRVSTGGERGFFSIAFPPDYATSHVFYADYTDLRGDSTVSRFRSSSDGRSADAGSEQVILKVRQPYPNHNGGQIAFGPDGMLYIGFGDGGGAGDPQRNAQDPGSLLGKLLRVSVSSSGRYTVPQDNPFVGRPGFRPEIWDLGLRNPWRFSFDASGGALYIADVGQNAWEEIDVEPRGRGGRNYGWNLREGAHPYPPGDTRRARGLTGPVAEYGHDQGESVSGGYVSRSADEPRIAGVYFYGDYGSGRLWALAPADGAWKSARVADTGLSIAGFGQDGAGHVYVLDIATGRVLRITGR